jgi:hypothetical protein
VLIAAGTRRAADTGGRHHHQTKCPARLLINIQIEIVAINDPETTISGGFFPDLRRICAKTSLTLAVPNVCCKVTPYTAENRFRFQRITLKLMSACVDWFNLTHA